jgi:DNA transformation protein
MSDSSIQLSTLPNIGKILAEKLVFIGVNTPQNLLALGSEKAFIRIHTIDNETCYNMLCALEGAIQGIRWVNLSCSRKKELNEFYKRLRGSI